MSEPSSLEGLSPLQRRELLAKLLRQRNGQQPTPPPASGGQPAVSRARTLRQSCAQQRLWVMNRLDDQDTSYNIVAYFEVQGALDEDALEGAFNQLARRHETLRTTFRAGDDGAALQEVTGAASVMLGRVDLASLSADAALSHLRQNIRTQQVTPFDLVRGPLLRVQSVRLAAEWYVVLIAIHHMIADGWSMGVLARDLGELYSAIRARREHNLPPLPIQYGDFAEWQSGWLEDKRSRRQLDYWAQRLEGLGALQLPLDFPRPVKQRFGGDQRELTLPRELSEKLRQLAARRGKTLFMVLYAAMTALMARVSGQHDIAIGSTIANRNRAELEGLIGFFVNMLVMRTDVSDDPTFDQLLERASQSALDAYANQDCPFEKIVERVAPDRDTSRNPLFQVALAVHNQRMAAPAMEGVDAGELFLPGFTVGGLGVATQRTRFDLELHLWDRAEGLSGTLVFDTDLFRGETIEHLLESFRVLLEAAAAAPQTRLSELPMVSPRQRTMLEAWGDRPASFPREASVHGIFESQAARRPGATALVSGDDEWTYAQLNARANQVAHCLIGRGVNHGEFVSLLLPRSMPTIAAMLGVLKAGAAYVPLDPAYPAGRLEFMLDDVQAQVVLTTAALRERVPSSARQVVCIDELFAAASGDLPNLQREVRGDDAAYVMYTSGSTGAPKGVLIPHRGINRLVLNNDYCPLNENAVLLQLATLSFDASTFEIWGALLNGGRCALYDAPLPTPTDVGEALKKHGVTTLFLTTALFNTIVDERPEAFSTLQAILFGGEAASAPHVRRAMQILPHVQISNIYGPTEVTTFSLCGPIVRPPGERETTIPIGGVIRNTTARVLDRNQRLVPPGVPGELYLGGDGLALGYHRRAELTAERFMTLDDGRRWYRTGDLVRWLARTDGDSEGSGVIEFLGRLDGQVKVHGFRIELAEVEAALLKCEGVNQGCVIAAGEGAARRLVAYIVAAHPNRGIDFDRVRAMMRALVPEFMVPSQFVGIDRLPLNANGKVDKAALPAPEAHHAEPPGDAAEADTPVNDVEQHIMQVWRDVLNVQSLGVTDNFFDVGGQSLLLVQVHERLRRSVAPTLPVVDLFQYPTVRSLAQHVARMQAVEPETVAAAPAATALSAAQQRAARQRQALQRRQAIRTEGQE